MTATADGADGADDIFDQTAPDTVLDSRQRDREAQRVAKGLYSDAVVEARNAALQQGFNTGWAAGRDSGLQWGALQGRVWSVVGVGLDVGLTSVLHPRPAHCCCTTLHDYSRTRTPGLWRCRRSLRSCTRWTLSKVG
jgi:hypothetical protein